MNLTKSINQLLNDYCKLRDRQYAVYDKCAKINGLTINELFVLDILWFSNNGETQKTISERMSVNKQTINSIINKLEKQKFVKFIEVEKDKRNKLVCLTDSGKEYAKDIIPPAAKADNLAMAELGLTKAQELVKLTTELTENMEKHFKSIKEK